MLSYSLDGAAETGLPEGVRIERTYRIPPTGFEFDLDVKLENRSDRLVSLNAGDEGFWGLWMGPVNSKFIIGAVTGSPTPTAKVVAE